MKTIECLLYENYSTIYSKTHFKIDVIDVKIAIIILLLLNLDLDPACQSGGIPLICFPIYKTENEKQKMTIFLFCILQTLKRKKEITGIFHF